MTPLLSVAGLAAGYHGTAVVHDIELEVGPGEVVTLLGRNGMGKSTTVKAVMGLLTPLAGRIRVAGADLTGAPPFRIAAAGIGYVPEGRQVFPTLTVEENLIATGRAGVGSGKPWDLSRVYAFFPQLARRKAAMGAELSGGEQQMLAIGRALMTNPRLMILDEATEGLAPLVRAEIWQRLAQLKAEGLAIVLIDKNIAALNRLADRHLIMVKGEIVWRGSPAELAADARVRDGLLSLTAVPGG